MVIEARWAKGRAERFPDLIADVTRSKVEVLENLKLQRQLDAATRQRLLQVVDQYQGTTTGERAYSLADTAGHAEH
jgi:hypothetical protein